MHNNLNEESNDEKEVAFRPGESLVAMLQSIEDHYDRHDVKTSKNRVSNNCRIDRKLAWILSSSTPANITPCGYLLFLDFGTHESSAIEEFELKVLKRAVLLDDLEEAEAEDANFVALKFDLITSLQRCGLVRREFDGKIISIEYSYHRLDRKAHFEIFNYSAFSTVGADHIVLSDEPLRKIDFLLSQYCFYHCSPSIAAGEQHKVGDVNIIAKGLEGSGRITRKVLQSTGSATGEVIRFLGRTYTSTYIAASTFYSNSSIHSLTSTNSNDVISAREQSIAQDSRIVQESTESAVEQACRGRSWAESIHSGARVFTSTALYPVRWTGRKASELAVDLERNEISTTKKIILDTMGGLGNGLVNVCKGVTEIISEVGDAIGDSAMHHSRAVYGDEYANNVTKAYVDAAGELGLAGYKICNVASLGLPGILIDAAIEGTSFMISLEEYLMGPVLQQGYVDLIQLPTTEMVRYFVILRPWSIAFYKNTADVMGKPFKIIPTAMLDTIPILRQRGQCSASKEPANEAHNVMDIPTAEAVQEPTCMITSVVEDHFIGHLDELSLLGEESPSIGLIATDADVSVETTQTETDNSVLGKGKGFFEQGKESFNRTTQHLAHRMQSTVHSLMGGDRTHIELCTVDCSTYLLYFANNQVTSLWYSEVCQACNRVETIEKRRSGAEELAFYRRLSLLPKRKVLHWRLLNFESWSVDTSLCTSSGNKHEGDSVTIFLRDLDVNEEHFYGENIDGIASDKGDRLDPSTQADNDGQSEINVAKVIEIRELQRKFSSGDYSYDDGYSGSHNHVVQSEEIHFQKGCSGNNKTGTENIPICNDTATRLSAGVNKAKVFMSGLSAAATEATSQLLDRAVLVSAVPKTFSGAEVGTERYTSTVVPLATDQRGFIAIWSSVDQVDEQGDVGCSFEFGRSAGIFNAAVENHDHCTAEIVEVIVYFKASFGLLQREVGRGSLHVKEIEGRNADTGPEMYTIPIFGSNSDGNITTSGPIGSIQVMVLFKPFSEGM